MAADRALQEVDPARPRPAETEPSPPAGPGQALAFPVLSFQVANDAEGKPQGDQDNGEDREFLEREHGPIVGRIARQASGPAVLDIRGRFADGAPPARSGESFHTMSASNNYASSHDVVRISSKRFARSPWMPAYLTDQAILGIYSGRFYALGLVGDPVGDYWHLRRKAVLYDVPERPIEIAGCDAMTLLRTIFCRDVSGLREGRGTYAIACNHHGGILMDGILFRLGESRFWYVLADGAFEPWLEAHAAGLDVTIRDPESWVLQIQGPASLDLLPAILDDPPADPFRYFSIHRTTIGSHPFLVSRTGWTGEKGFELYPLSPDFDGPAMFRLILERGRPGGLIFSGLDSMGIRRMEAAIMDNGTDMDPSMTPFDAGLGRFVDLDRNDDFIGKAALARAPKAPRFFGLTASGITPHAGTVVLHRGDETGIVTAGAWSPFLESGIAYVRFDKADDWAGRTVTLRLKDGAVHEGTVVALPFYDRDKLIPRGLANEIP